MNLCWNKTDMKLNLSSAFYSALTKLFNTLNTYFHYPSVHMFSTFPLRVLSLLIIVILNS